MTSPFFSTHEKFFKVVAAVCGGGRDRHVWRMHDANKPMFVNNAKGANESALLAFREPTEYASKGLVVPPEATHVHFCFCPWHSGFASQNDSEVRCYAAVGMWQTFIIREKIVFWTITKLSPQCTCNLRAGFKTKKYSPNQRIDARLQTNKAR